MIKTKPIQLPKWAQKDVERIIIGITLDEWVIKQRKKYFPNSLKK